jgi:hypothetical protein
MAIYRLLQNLPMGPEEISRMTAAYEQTLRALHLDDRTDPIEISPACVQSVCRRVFHA